HNPEEIARSGWLDPRTEIRPSPIQGRGMYAVAPIAAGEPVVIWSGVVCTTAEIEVGKVAPRSTVAIGEGVYLGHPVGAYDRDRDDRGDFINHSCDPNVWMADAVTQTARRSIDAGEELTTDYATIEADETDVKPWECRCALHGVGGESPDMIGDSTGCNRSTAATSPRS
ncbi:MAG: nuclear protein, partial [Chloroflexi bacterium]|nr:nuclear protein [Chloroflexota bacterium]